MKETKCFQMMFQAIILDDIKDECVENDDDQTGYCQDNPSIKQGRMLVLNVLTYNLENLMI